MISLVGYTGFVGSNIYAVGKDKIDGIYNSKNINEAYGTQPDLLIYAGMRAEKYLANTDPDADMQLVHQAEENIKQIGAKRLVLISTVDIFKEPDGKDEDSKVETDGLHPYGVNRYELEQWVRKEYPDALIIRLPGLYGKNMKKNFIYDYIHVVPSVLSAAKFEELQAKERELVNYYVLEPNGFYKCRKLDFHEKKRLEQIFRSIPFTALNFTDSRSSYQFYPLSRLWTDIQTALQKGIKLWHPATEPVSASEVYRYLSDMEFVNEIAIHPAFYNYRTKYAGIFGGSGGYLMNKQQVREEIKEFVERANS